MPPLPEGGGVLSVRKAWSWPSLAPATTIRFPLAVVRGFAVRWEAKAPAESRASLNQAEGVPTVTGFERKVSPSFQLSLLYAASPRMNPTTSLRLVVLGTPRSAGVMLVALKAVKAPDLYV